MQPASPLENTLHDVNRLRLHSIRSWEPPPIALCLNTDWKKPWETNWATLQMLETFLLVRSSKSHSLQMFGPFICKSYFIARAAAAAASRQLLCFMEMAEPWRTTGAAFALILEGVCCSWLASRCVHTCFVYFAKSRLQLILMHVEQDEKWCCAEMH